jgi:hypothetical protein
VTGVALVQAILPHKNNITRDEVVNTFVFETLADPPDSTDVANIVTALTAFYNTIPSGFNSVAGSMNDSRSRVSNACRFAVYNIKGHLNGSPHGSPIAVTAWTLGAQASGGGALPAEVAAVLTYHRAYGSDVEFSPGSRPRARDRGRIYLGPFTSSALTLDSTTGRAHISTGLMTTMLDAGTALIGISSTVVWHQWSRKNATTAIVTAVKVDDAFDTIRGRGEGAQTFVSFP